MFLDLRIDHDRFGSSSNPDLNGKLHWTNDMDMSLNEDVGRVHSEFIRILFVQPHREADRFFAASGVQSAQSNMGVFFHFRRAAFSSMVKSRVSSILAKASDLRMNLNLDAVPITSKSHTHPLHSQTSRLLTSSLSLGVLITPTLIYTSYV
jgi:hypothetical protein